MSDVFVPCFYFKTKKLVIEIDESELGKKKYNRGYHVEGGWVFETVERTAKKSLFVKVEKRSKRVSTSELCKWVDHESIIYFDGWRGYNRLRNEYAEHQTLNHNLFYKCPITSVYTNTIEGTWCAVKAIIPMRRRTLELIYICI